MEETIETDQKSDRRPAASGGDPSEDSMILDKEEIEAASPEALFSDLDASEDGLSEEEAHARLETHGANALEEKRRNPVLKFLGYFWGPIPWMIEAAAILSAVLRHWTDLAIISFMLVFNAVVGFWQEFQADNALEALKGELALKARVRRDGEWRDIEARDLVPGDLIRLRLGDVVPADLKLVSGDYVSLDESALTGESLPVNKKPGDLAYSGSTVRQGEMTALVAATGGDTKFAKTAKLVEGAGSVSHFQKAVLTIFLKSKPQAAPTAEPLVV